MLSIRRLRPALVSALLAVPALAANQVFVVATAAGAGVDFTNVQSAINAAGEGDVILIKAGVYAGPFTITNKSLTLVADNGASVAFSATFSIGSLAAGKQVCVRGIDVDSTDSGTAMSLFNNVGSVWIEDCALTSGSTVFPFLPAGNGLSASTCGSVIAMRCSMTGATITTGTSGGYDGLLCSASNVCLYDCTLKGGAGGNGSNIFVGGDGAEVASGFLFASGSSFTGGKGGNGTNPTMPFQLCTNGASGGHGLHLSTTSPSAATVACSFAGGAGGAGGTPGTCVAGPAGLGIKVDTGTHTALTGTAHHMSATAAPREGQVLTKTYMGAPGEFVFVDFAVSQGFLYFPDFRGVLVLSSPIFTLFEGTIPAGGTLNKPATINSLGAGVEGVPLYLQSAFFNVVTGIFQAAPSVTVLLDSSL